jgi:Zn-dependent oligopeptidase
MAGNGVGLEAEKRVTFNEIKNKLEQLQNQFSNNVLDAKGVSAGSDVKYLQLGRTNMNHVAGLLITDKADVAGLPLNTLAPAPDTPAILQAFMYIQAVATQN